MQLDTACVARRLFAFFFNTGSALAKQKDTIFFLI